MKHRVVLLVIGGLALFTLGFAARGIMERSTAPTPRVIGIGGIFFKCKDPGAMRAWYGRHFGMPMNEYGAVMEFRTSDPPREKGYLQWSPFGERTTYFAPSTKEFMINYRVNDIDGLVAALRSDSVTVLDSIERFDYGAFVHVMDPEGNKIELWEPLDSSFTRLYEGTTVK
jgi:predicted enzyme related to lactoylglutathione lyase